MRKKLGITILTILLLLPLISALDTSQVYSVYNCDTSVVFESAYGHNFTTNTNIIQNSTVFKNGKACTGVGGTNDVLITPYVGFANTTTSNWAISMWAYGKHENGGAFQGALDGQGEDSILQNMDTGAGADGTRHIQRANTGTPLDTLETNLFTDDTWHHFLFQFNNDADRLELYHNGVNIVNSSQTTQNPILDFRLFNDRNLGSDFHGTLDEIYVFNTTLTQGEIQQLAASNTASYYPFTATLINATSPPDNSSFNTNPIFFQANISSYTGTTYNVSLWINNTLNQTITGLINSTTNTFNASLTPGTYTYTLGWYDGTSGANSTTNTIYFDSTDPIITWTTPGTQNYYGNYTTNITVTDENLYSYNYNLTYLNGTLIYSSINTSLTGHTTKTITDFIDLSSHTGVDLQANLQVCDGHTAQRINKYEIRRVSNGLAFEGVRVTGQDSTRQTYTRKTDRYSFGFTYDTPSLTRTFRVQSTKPISILHGQTQYQGHLITGSNWVDFEMFGTSVISVQRINQNTVDVTVLGIAPLSTYNFNSIGNLNCVVQTGRLHSTRATQTTTAGSLTGQTNTYGLNLTYNSSFPSVGSPISAKFNYNNTVYNPTLTNTSTLFQYLVSVETPIISSQTNFSYYWNFTLNNVKHVTTTQTQTANVPSLDTCTTNTIPFLNVTLRDEISDSLINHKLDYIFDYSHGSFSSTLNNSIPSTSNAQWCKSPANTTFYTDWHLQYSANGYVTRDYYVNNWTINDTLTLKTLYSLSNANSTAITIHVKDSADNDLTNILIEVYRFDIPTNKYILVDTKKTDTDGNGVVNVNTNGAEYKIKLYQGTTLAVETGRFQMFNTNYEYTINAISNNPLSEYLRVKTDLSHTLTYTNSTKFVNLSYTKTGSLINNVCLLITANTTNYYNACSQTSINELTYTLTQLNLSYTAIASVNTTTGNTYQISTLSIQTRTTLKDILGNGTGLLLGLIIFLLLSFLAIINVNAAIIGGIVSIIFLWLFGLLPVGTPGLVTLISFGIISLIIINRRPSA